MKEENTDPGYTRNPEDVFTSEKIYLQIENRKPLCGLAISGGGIRSASFGMGVMQALVSNNQLAKMDYMSTVSGGGYLGSALTWALHIDKNAGTTPANFPLGKRGSKGGKLDTVDEKPVPGKDNKLLDFIRQHGSYLTPTKNLDIISFAAVVMRSMVMSLFVYISFITILLTSALWLIYNVANSFFEGVNTSVNKMLGFHLINTNKGLMIAIGIFILCVMLFMGFLYSLSTFLSSERAGKVRYKGFIKGQKTIGFMLKLSATCLVFGSLPYVSELLNGLIKATVTAGSSTIFGTAVGIWQYIKARKSEKNSGGSTDILIYAGAFALIYGVLLFAYIFATRIYLDKNLHFAHPYWFLILAVLSFLFGFFVNLNYIGPHYVWRSRLMEAFMPNKEAVQTNCWEPSTEADSALMEDMCNPDNPRPYHILNTNIILSNSPQIDYSGRGGDNFIISPLYCGSDATGWKTTKTFQKNKTRGITLASAMATSAAALNPNAGVSGEGVTRNTVVSILLSMLNLRLGYWTSNPAKENVLDAPNFFSPGLTSEVFRSGLTETNNNLMLSDGGHYENLAIYELIRRKLDLIVVSDGGADPNFNFDDLANAIEKVRVDFDTRIYFRDGYKPDDILPLTAGDSFFQKKYDIAKHGFAIGDIIYNDGTTGTLVYIKLAMIEGLPTDVYSYKGVNPTFPHQSTADQFFDEKQFEAYRELGYYVAWQMMESEEGKKIFQ